MDDLLPFLWLGVAAIGLALSFLCSGLETGVYTLNPIGLEVRLGRGERAARGLAAELARPGRLIATLLIANNVANYLFSLGVAELLAPLGWGAFASALVNGSIGLTLGFLFAETLPKDLFRTFTDRWTYLAWPLLRAARVTLTWCGVLPLVSAVAEAVTRRLGGSEADALAGPRSKIARLIKEGIDAGVISERQWTFAERALALRGTSVASEMTPWSRVAAVGLSDPPEVRAGTLRRSGASRLPVVAADGRVVGVLNTLDAILRPDAPTAELMSEPVFFPPTESTLAALRTLRSVRARLGVVRQEGSGRPLGVVAIKDLVEPITGQLAGS